MSTQRVYILLTLCVLFWSGNFILGRFVSSNIEPLELAFFRWLFVLILTSPFLLFLDLKKIIKVYKKNFYSLTFCSFLGITLFNTFLYIALNFTTATNALLINSIIPILILVFSFFILKTRILKIQFFGILLSTFGVIFLILKGDISSILELSFSKGDLWVVASSIVWAIYSTIIKLKPKELKSYRTIFHNNLCWLYTFTSLVFLPRLYNRKRNNNFKRKLAFLFIYFIFCFIIIFLLLAYRN